jgi:outer membrane receptor protein involved in Fe transport
MRRIPPLNGRLGLRYQPYKQWFNSIEWQCASKQDRLAAGDKSDPRIPKGGTPGWNVLNLRSAYQFKQVELQAGLNNLFNDAYRTHGSGIDGVGRSVWVGLDWRF